MKKFIYNLKEISQKDVDVAGGKGASLGEMTQAGFPIPRGFVVSSEAFDEFLKINGLNIEVDTILKKTNPKNIHSVKQSSDSIRMLISKTNISKKIEEDIIKAYDELSAKHVAVRSSATTEDSATSTWAGQLDTYLDTTREDLLKKVKNCWSSLFSPRAIFYHLEKGFDEDQILVAVVIQEMIDADVAGVSFSVHPVTEDEDQLLIEAGFGLGESIVSGQITPDGYVVEKNKKKILGTNIRPQTQGIFPARGGGVEWRKIPKEKQNKQKLSESDIKKVASLVLGVERHYGFPVDVEWAKKDGEFFIIQSRPITAMRNTRIPEEKRRVLIKHQGSHHSLFGINIKYEVLKNGLQNYLEISSGETCAVYKKGDDGFDLYQEKGIFSQMVEAAKKYSGNTEAAKKIINRYSDGFEKLRAYYEGEKIIEGSEDLKKFYDACVRYQSLHMLVSAISEAKNIPEEIKAEAHSRRIGAMQYAGYYERIFFIYLKEFYPGLAENTRLISPEEVWQKLPEERLKKVISKRKDGVVFYNGSLCVGEKRKCLEEFNVALKEVKQKRKDGEFEGQPTYPGIARGIARVVMNIKDLDKIIEGEIIISPTTTPDHIPIMKKVAACVTDEGGVGSHTAIISREMKKPCVVGLGNATQVIKDGDEIEVDADNGVVRILKKAN